MLHFHTSENTPGYLPEADSAPYFATENAAIASANAEAAEYAETVRDEGGVAYIAGEGTAYVLVVRSDRLYDLGRAFAVDACVEACEAA